MVFAVVASGGAVGAMRLLPNPLIIQTQRKNAPARGVLFVVASGGFEPSNAEQSDLQTDTNGARTLAITGVS
ncbi:hypothetical protein GCM10027022_19420 [Alpinimonas psychrophila]